MKLFKNKEQERRVYQAGGLVLLALAACRTLEVLVEVLKAVP